MSTDLFICKKGSGGIEMVVEKKWYLRLYVDRSVNILDAGKRRLLLQREKKLLIYFHHHVKDVNMTFHHFQSGNQLDT